MELHDRQLVSDAIAFAAVQHRAQPRKGPSEPPYVFHPTQVMLLLWEVGVRDAITLAAAVLHDTIEDTETTADDILQRFGAEVAAVVTEVSDDRSLPKAARKRLQIERAALKSERARLVKLADKVMNLTDMLAGPPPHWSELRRRQYLGWTKCVVDPMRGTHPALEARFDALYGRADPAPWPTDDADVAE